MTIPNSSWISTGPRGRVELERGVEKVSFGPKTLAAIFTENGLFSRETRVVQQKGEIALDIEKRSRPHTYVHTPFLAAVVKGTSFTVTVTAKAASVSVEEGLVQVSSFTGGQSTNVGPGQQVTVDQAQNMSVAGLDEPPSVFSVEPVQASVPAVGQAAPVGAGLGLGSFGDRSSAGETSDSGSIGVSGERSEGGNTFGQQAAGRGNADDKNERGGGNGHGDNGNGNGSGGGNGDDDGDDGDDDD
nr:FecR family protein [Rhizobium halophilum]